MVKLYLALAALLGMSAVMLGAFAAHGLKHKLSDTLLAVFQTGVQYQMYHALAMLLVMSLHMHIKQPLLLYSGGFLLAGVILFSGSLYGLSLFEIKWLGPITPIGGLCFIIGWALLFTSIIKQEWLA